MRQEQTKETEFEAPWLYLAGPLFLLCTLAIASRPSLQEHLYLLSIALIGLFCIAYYKMRGCVFALLLFGFAAVVKHGLFTTDHMWQFGLEGSLACGLLITALTLDQRKTMVDGLQELAKTRESTILHLEEDMCKLMESNQAHQISLQEKLAEKQKELEELQTEKGTILILNEVLRKNLARQTEEAEILAENGLDKERRIGSLHTEIDDLQKELARVSNLSGLSQENATLLKELNSARVDKAQTNLINETLVRLHAKEAQKAQEASERFHAQHSEKQRLQEELGAAHGEIQMLSTHLQQVSEELEKSLTSLKQAEKLQIEKTFLQQRLHNAELELAAAAQKMESMVPQPPVKESPSLQAEREALLEKLAQKESYLAQIEGKMQTIPQMEALYRQLRSQFEEKNAVLHETRAKLFLAETQLQKFIIEKEQTVHSEPLPPDLQQEILELEKEVVDLQFENDQLQEIITYLSNGEPPASSGKKN